MLYECNYGSEKLKFTLDDKLILQELKIKETVPLSNPEAAILNAIRNPIDSKPLKDIVKRKDKIAFIVNDLTRIANSHVFMPILVNELNEAGIPDDDMYIVFALGTHRLMTNDEMKTAVGEEIARRLKMYNSDCRDDSAFDYLGTTSRGTEVYVNKLVTGADHVICTGSVVHHFFAGFGGGRKAIVPGVAAYETVRHNHSMIFDENATLGKLDGNPIYEDQIEAVKMCPPSFLLNVVLNEKKEFLKIFAGHYITAHRAACNFVDEVYGTPLKEEADLVIASCGGYPKDINVYQMQKTMDNAQLAVRKGGIVIMLGECREGTGSELYEKTMRDLKTLENIENSLKSNFQIGAHKAYAVARLMKKAEYVLVSGLDDELARILHFTPAKSIEDALTYAYKKLGNNPKIILMPQGSLTVPIK